MKKQMNISSLRKYVRNVLKEAYTTPSNKSEVPDSSSEITNIALKIGPKLMNNPNLLKIADKISKDPKAVSDIQKYVNSINGGISEEVEIGNDFIKKSIEKGIMLTKNMQEDSVTKKIVDKNLHIPMYGIAGLVGGYLADKYFDNPIIEKAAYATAEYIQGIGTVFINHAATSELTHNPNLIMAAGAAIGLIVSYVALMVLDKVKQKSVDDFDLGSLFFPKALRKDLNQKSKINEDDSNLRAMLHTLVGNEMKSGKRADMHGSHHVEEHKKAEKELENFLSQNPSMLEFVEEVEEHFMKQLYK